MLTPTDPDAKATLARLRLPLALTRAGMLAERVIRAFWPLWSIAILCLAALMLGLHDKAPVEAVWGAGVIALAAGLWFAWRGARAMRWPGRTEALARLDATLPGRPIGAMLDAQAVGASDPASRAVWEAHRRRMAARAAEARAVRPDLRIARRDPFALRYVALLIFCVALLFGSVLRVATLAEMTPGGATLAGGPAWEGWVEPPAYTGLPAVYLADTGKGPLAVPEGSRVTVRLYGKVGALTLTETVSGRTTDIPSAADTAQSFEVRQSGRIEIGGPGGRAWAVTVVPDAPPEAAISGPVEASARGELTLPFTASDDYGIASGEARITLDLGAVDRRYGLAAEPEPRDAITVPLPLPVTGARDDFAETLIEDFSQHPWANLPVRIELGVTDAAAQDGGAAPVTLPLASRRFFDPLAAAVIEQRRDLLWSRDNAARVAQILRAMSWHPEDVFRSEKGYLRLRVILRRLEAHAADGLSAAHRDEIAAALWDLAVLLEDGDLGDALERLRRAQDRLAEAMKNGASDTEIAELMQDLRQATEDYMRQLSRQAQQEGEQAAPEMSENALRMSQDDLQRMMDRIQELMEQGRMAEAQQALEELRRMMENMRVTQGQGQGQPSQGQQAMEGLADTLRGQQDLSDRAFRDLQDRFNPDPGTGQRPGQDGAGQPGENGPQGRQPGGEGSQPGPQDGQGRSGEPGQQPGAGSEGTLADRQEALRRELERQRQALPGTGTEQGRAAREALERADRAMDGAERALRGGDMAEAIDRQSEAMEALREGMRNLGEALAQEQRERTGQGDTPGDMSAQQRDPLGRNAGSAGPAGTDEGLLQGEDVYRRARELLDEIRRRSGEGARPEVELDYLRRLLERF